MEKSVKYPENIYLKEEIKKSGYRSNFLANKVGISNSNFNKIINGHIAGRRVVVDTRKFLGLDNE